MKYFSMFTGIGGFERGIEEAFEDYENQSITTPKGQQQRILQGSRCDADSEQICVGTEQSDCDGESEKVGIQRQQDLRRNLTDSVECGEYEWSSSRNGAKSAACIGYSEIDERAIEIYRYHYPEHKNYGDASRIIPDELGDFNLLVGGFPCQAFSIAGKRQGFADIRGTLFFEIARILEAKKPRNFLLENVGGLFSHDNGRTFRTIIRTLTDLGYFLEWDYLNSKDFSVPQNRQRVFLVGYFGRIPRREIFPLGDGNKLLNKKNQRQSKQTISTTIRPGMNGIPGNSETYIEIIDKSGKPKNKTIASTLQAGGNGAGNHGDMDLIQIGTLRTHNDGKGFRQMKDGNCPTIPARAREDGSGQPVILQANPSIESGGKQPYQQNRIYDENGISPALQAELSSGSYAVQTTQRIRRLTPLETERLQGFPDLWTKFGSAYSIPKKYLIAGPLQTKKKHTIQLRRELSIPFVNYSAEYRNLLIWKTVEMSDTSRYKACGNAVTCNVIKAIISKMIEAGRFELFDLE